VFSQYNRAEETPVFVSQVSVTLSRTSSGVRLPYFNELERGNHFAAWQEPALFAEELRAAFRSLRASGE
jgi:hypothetical protein